MKEEFTFHGQREGEVVKIVVKNHPFILFVPGLKSIFFLLLGISTMLMISNEATGLVLVVCIAVAMGIFARAYYDFSQSVLIITDQRLINVGQEGFWKRDITETSLDKIQDVSSHTNGMSRVMLKYGDLIIRTAGATQGGEIKVKSIPNPYEVQQRIAKLNG